MGKISGSEVSAIWYNPRNGESKVIGKFPNRDQLTFNPPTLGYGHDWVLIVDDSVQSGRNIK